LLANLYMRRFVLGWKQLGYEEGLKARIVNYADDFVILSVNKGQEAYEAMKQMMKKLGLEVNEGKTRLCQQGAGTSAYPDE
jgi:RNA-directed DNA polymerase